MISVFCGRAASCGEVGGGQICSSLRGTKQSALTGNSAGPKTKSLNERRGLLPCAPLRSQWQKTEAMIGRRGRSGDRRIKNWSGPIGVDTVLTFKAVSMEILWPTTIIILLLPLPVNKRQNRPGELKAQLHGLQYRSHYRCSL